MMMRVIRGTKVDLIACLSRVEWCVCATETAFATCLFYAQVRNQSVGCELTLFRRTTTTKTTTTTTETRMQVHGFTEKVNDTGVRFQVTCMKDSVLIWIQQVSGGSGGGSFRRMAAAMPGTAGFDGLPATTAVLGGYTEAIGSERLAARLARRCDAAVYACVDVGDLGEVAGDLIFSRVLRLLDGLGMVVK